MVASSASVIRHESKRLCYEDACCISDRILAGAASGPVILDLRQTEATQTAALARLILLRRHLPRNGRDLRIVGLAGKAKDLYEVNRLHPLLPMCPNEAAAEQS